MTRDDLFLAIGQVEESHLARSENFGTSNVTALEEGTMKQKMIKRRSLRLMLVAAVMVCLIASIALVSASREIQLEVYETPEAMLEAAFGINGYPGAEGSVSRPDDWKVNNQYINAYEREELDQALAEKLIEPYVYKIGETVTHNGGTLRAEAVMYDSVTGVGVIYFSAQGIDYRLQDDGELWKYPVDVNNLSKGYIDMASTTEDTLYGVEYFVYNTELRSTGRGDNLWITLNGAEQRIDIPADAMGGMESVNLGDGAVTLSPVGILLNGEKLGMLTDTNELLLGSLVIRYADGSEYVIGQAGADASSPDMENYAYGVQSDGVLIYALNRIVDVEQVAAVVVDGVELSVDQN